MRRFVLSTAVMSALALSACSGGGSVLGFNNGGGNADRVIITVQAPSNIARVLPGGSLALSATGVRGSQNGVGPSNRFKWSAALVAGGQYVFNADGQTRACQTITLTPFAPPGPPVPFTADYGLYIAIDPVNEANILFQPPVVIPNPVPASATLGNFFPYCVVVNAQALDGGAVGSITVAVVNPANPLQ